MVYVGREEVARHERLIARGATRLEPDHYLEAREAADAEPEEPAQPPVPGSPPGIAPLPAAVRARLPPDTRPLPSVAHYNRLLRLRRSDRPTT